MLQQIVQIILSCDDYFFSMELANENIITSPSIQVKNQGGNTPTEKNEMQGFSCHEICKFSCEWSSAKITI